jgi:cytochrome c
MSNVKVTITMEHDDNESLATTLSERYIVNEDQVYNNSWNEIIHKLFDIIVEDEDLEKNEIGHEVDCDCGECHAHY